MGGSLRRKREDEASDAFTWLRRHHGTADGYEVASHEDHKVRIDPADLRLDIEL